MVRAPSVDGSSLSGLVRVVDTSVVIHLATHETERFFADQGRRDPVIQERPVSGFPPAIDGYRSRSKRESPAHRRGEEVMLADIDLGQGVQNAWDHIITFVPKLLGFAIILVIGYFIAKALSKLADALLERVGFDGWVERGSLKQAFERSKFDASDTIGVVVFWAVFLVALQLAFGVFGPNPISDLIQGMVAFLPNIFVGVVILVVASAVAKVVTDLLSTTLAPVSGGRWIARAAGFAILMIGVFATLNQLQIAPEIVNGLYYAILVIIAGSAIVAIGGGGIQTMRGYWERASHNLEGTAREIKQSAGPYAADRDAQTLVMPESESMVSAGGGTAASGRIPPPPPGPSRSTT
jgi:Conserved TM helix